MAVHDLRKAQKGVSGQTTTFLGFGDNAKLEKRVSGLENKLDTIITLLKKEDKDDKNRLKPVSGNDGGV